LAQPARACGADRGWAGAQGDLAVARLEAEEGQDGYLAPRPRDRAAAIACGAAAAVLTAATSADAWAAAATSAAPAGVLGTLVQLATLLRRVLLLVALPFAAAAWLSGLALREWRQARRLLPEQEVAFHDSRFVRAGAVTAHYIQARAPHPRRRRRALPARETHPGPGLRRR